MSLVTDFCFPRWVGSGSCSRITVSLRGTQRSWLKFFTPLSYPESLKETTVASPSSQPLPAQSNPHLRPGQQNLAMR